MAICLFSFFRTSKHMRRKIGGRDNATGVVVRVVSLETISQKVFFRTHFSQCSRVKWGSYITNSMWSIVFVLEVQVCFHPTSLVSLKERGFNNIVILPDYFELMINTHLKDLELWSRTGNSCVETAAFLLHQRELSFSAFPFTHCWFNFRACGPIREIKPIINWIETFVGALSKAIHILPDSCRKKRHWLGRLNSGSTMNAPVCKHQHDGKNVRAHADYTWA